jgi:hypothetical protein
MQWSQLKINTALLITCFLPVTFLAYSSVMNVEAIYSSETHYKALYS